MTSVFRLRDTLRCMLVDAPGDLNMAAPIESIVRRRPIRNSTFWAQSLNLGLNRVTVGDWDGIKLTSLASARTRGGISSWEVDRLHLTNPHQALQLLEHAVYSASCRGAEKIFLRVPDDSKLMDTAIRAGFFPYFNEVHLSGPGDNASVKADDFSAEQRTPEDLHGLFQLYFITTPLKVRQEIGMTIDQWLNSLEPLQTRRNESILKLDGKIIGCQICDPFGKGNAGQIVSHPEHPESTQYLIDISYQTQSWLVPDYQKTLMGLLQKQGLQELGRYTMLIKTASVLVKSPEFSYVEA